MKTVSKKSLLLVLLTVLLSTVCAFCALNFAGSAFANEDVTVPTENVTVAESGFTVRDSASVNVSEDR